MEEKESTTKEELKKIGNVLEKIEWSLNEIRMSLASFEIHGITTKPRKQKKKL